MKIALDEALARVGDGMPLPSAALQALTLKAVERGVAYLPEAPLYAVNAQVNTLRLSFATVAGPDLERGVDILGALLTEELSP
jgi:DNA-binding transcriptional MocR family regulator